MIDQTHRKCLSHRDGFLKILTKKILSVTENRIKVDSHEFSLVTGLMVVPLSRTGEISEGLDLGTERGISSLIESTCGHPCGSIY